MLQMVKAKFDQNPELCDELRATGKKTIAESGKHNIFASGLSIRNKDILDMKQWTGQSKLGEILMTVCHGGNFRQNLMLFNVMLNCAISK